MWDRVLRWCSLVTVPSGRGYCWWVPTSAFQCRFVWIMSECPLARPMISVAAYDGGELAAVFASPRCIDRPLWREFAAMELAGYEEAWQGWDPQRAGFACRLRPFGVDYELVLLGHVAAYTEPAVVNALPFLMHLTDDVRQVAAAGSDTPPVPGWPPTFPDPRYEAE